jgi:hypothetical protein
MAKKRRVAAPVGPDGRPPTHIVAPAALWVLALGTLGCIGSIGVASPQEGAGGSGGPPGDPTDPSQPPMRPELPPEMAMGENGLPSAALAPPTGLRRLTSAEYDNTLRDLIGDVTRSGGAILPADARTPFDNDYTVQVASKALVDGLDLLAREAVARLLADRPRRDGVVGCTPAGAGDAACFRTFVTRLGRRALRRPLSSDEIARYEGVFLPLGRDSGDFFVAVQSALETLLQHPELVYRMEIGKPVAGQSGLFRLDDWEMAARMSFLLWGAPPDDGLLDAAAAGGLGSAAGLRAQATRLLGDARARDWLLRFHALWLRYEGMTGPAPEIVKAMQAETAALVKKVVFEEQRPWRDIFRAEETFVSAPLAQHYGLPAPAAAAGGWVPLDGSGRKGILAQGTFLSNGAKGGDTSPVMRGLAIRELLLCETIPPPPPGVDSDTPPPASGAGDCKQDRYAVHRAGGCASCHDLLDKLGFGLEGFDQQGRARATEAGKPGCAIDGQGELKDVGTFRGPAELADLLLARPEPAGLGTCAAQQLYRFAVGRHALDAADKQFADLLMKRQGGADFRLGELLLDLVSSDGFRHRREER